jgi:hypothetical protein
MISSIATESRRSELIRLPIVLPAELYEWLRVTAFHRHVSMAELVREAIREHRQQHEPQLPLPLGGTERER